jgi:hypothetical protein
MEQNKTGRYFKYAIGEIILVVIGILIALSINNWNENRLLKNKEIILVKQLLEDARADGLFFKDRSYKLKIQSHYFKNLISYCEGMPTIRDTIAISESSNEPFMKLASQSNLLKNNPNAYDELLSPTLKKELQKYVSKYEFVYLAIAPFNSQIEEYYTSWIINYHKEVPKAAEIKTYENMSFLCDDDRNLGILNVLIFSAYWASDQTDEFVKINMALTKKLEHFLEKNND